MDLNEFYKYHVDSVIVSTKEVELLYKKIDELTRMNEELSNDLKSSDKIIIYPGLGINALINSTSVSKNGMDYTTEFIKDYIGRYPWVNEGNSQKVLNLLLKFIDTKLEGSWFTRKFKSRILKALGL